MFWSEPVRTYRGRAELREWFRRVVEPWERFHVKPEEITQVADDRVFGAALVTARGKGSAETQVRGWFVVWVANGMITRRRVFLDRAEALEAAGLEE